MDSAGVWLVQWIPPESSGLAQQKKSGRIPRTPLEYAGFRWTPPDSSRNKYADLALVTPRHSRIPGVSGGTCGGVYSPLMVDKKITYPSIVVSFSFGFWLSWDIG